MLSRRFLNVGLFGVLLLTGVIIYRRWRAEDHTLVEREPDLQADYASEVNLLELVDPVRDAVQGRWRLEEGSLVSSTAPFGRLEIPYAPPPNYVLSLVLQRRGGKDSMDIGLVRGTRQFLAILDGTPGGDRSGLDMIDAKGFMDNPSTYQGKVLPWGTETSIECTVRKNRVTVSANNVKIIDWSGPSGQLSLYSEWKVPHPDRLFIGSYASEFKIKQLKLYPLSPGGRRLQ